MEIVASALDHASQRIQQGINHRHKKCQIRRQQLMNEPIHSETGAPDAESLSTSPKILSVRKLEANRQNGKKSTGPRTAEGKERSRLNALKHGILAKAVVIQGGPGKEKRADFDLLLSEFWQHYSPQGPVEEMLVERMAHSNGASPAFIGANAARSWRITSSTLRMPTSATSCRMHGSQIASCGMRRCSNAPSIEH
jgi:hypothetical protein